MSATLEIEVDPGKRIQRGLEELFNVETPSPANDDTGGNRYIRLILKENQYPPVTVRFTFPKGTYKDISFRKKADEFRFGLRVV